MTQNQTIKEDENGATPLMVSLRAEFLKDAISTIGSGLEYAIECLANHEISHGRTTIKNKRLAEMMESDIQKMKAVIKQFEEIGI